MGRPPSDARERILDAASRVVTGQGVQTLTIEAVAREAGISKGGVLYHFGTKEALIRGLVDEAVLGFDAEVAALVQADPEPHGRLTRAMVRASLKDAPDPRHAALLAAVAADLSLLESMRQRHALFQEVAGSDGLDPIAETLIHAAADGIWINGLFGMPAPPMGIARLRERLIAMTLPPGVQAPTRPS